MTHEQQRSTMLAAFGAIIIVHRGANRLATAEALAVHLASAVCHCENMASHDFIKLDLSKLATVVLSAAVSAVKEEAREQLG